ncbi:MAG: hypothetical protein V4665_00265 [Patescibacteria group bacterium]
MKRNTIIVIICFIIILLSIWISVQVSRDPILPQEPPILSSNSGNKSPQKIFTDSSTGISFTYPEKLSARYISAQEWPPIITVTEGKFSCPTGGSEIETGGTTELKMIEGKNYCVTEASEGAAGSIYTTYDYKALRDDKLVTVHFALRFVQCGNYDDPEMSQCQEERSLFKIDPIAGSILDSIAF